MPIKMPATNTGQPKAIADLRATQCFRRFADDGGLCATVYMRIGDRHLLLDQGEMIAAHSVVLSLDTGNLVQLPTDEMVAMTELVVSHIKPYEESLF